MHAQTFGLEPHDFEDNTSDWVHALHAQSYFDHSKRSMYWVREAKYGSLHVCLPDVLQAAVYIDDLYDCWSAFASLSGLFPEIVSVSCTSVILRSLWRFIWYGGVLSLWCYIYLRSRAVRITTRSQSMLTSLHMLSVDSKRLLIYTGRYARDTQSDTSGLFVVFHWIHSVFRGVQQLI